MLSAVRVKKSGKIIRFIYAVYHTIIYSLLGVGVAAHQPLAGSGIRHLGVASRHAGLGRQEGVGVKFGSKNLKVERIWSMMAFFSSKV